MRQKVTDYLHEHRWALFLFWFLFTWLAAALVLATFAGVIWFSVHYGPLPMLIIVMIALASLVALSMSRIDDY